ncbi:hypothetical protein [Corynebacterium liangguodongii]|uniref:Uncharacterized protein n=1 Tax=Corynebacterium liangguodongii TaxID=2079535 RepID=A0A2S0WBF9_9CORY|nr:hypothetical protein [Corynebacterium liangguodongii]AWB83096.1 hypothetical protein C3E79_00155 [Corynebacterium liangguodongii]PWB99303.1 hypothetical protein DF219_06920 [Corynebacterium liangguodongii]
MDPLLRTQDLVLRKGDGAYSFAAGEGLTLLLAGRESGASTLSMALAGRYNPAAGHITLRHPAGTATSTRERFRHTALAGVSLIDSLERSVTVREILREQIAWRQPFFRPIPRDVCAHALVEPWLAPLGLAGLDTDARVGEVETAVRLRLRVLLALVSRPRAGMLVVDDPDQLRDIGLRNAFLDDLTNLAQHLPVVVTSVNPDVGGHAAHVVDLREGASR